MNPVSVTVNASGDLPRGVDEVAPHRRRVPDPTCTIDLRSLGLSCCGTAGQRYSHLEIATSKTRCRPAPATVLA